MNISDKLKEHLISTNPDRLHNSLITIGEYNRLVSKQKDGDKPIHKTIIYPDQISKILKDNLYIVHLNGDLSDDVIGKYGWLGPNPLRKNRNVIHFLKQFEEIKKNKYTFGVLQQKNARFPRYAFNGVSTVTPIQEYDSKISFYGFLEIIISDLTVEKNSRNLI